MVNADKTLMSALGRKRTLGSVQIGVSKRSAFGQKETFERQISDHEGKLVAVEIPTVKPGPSCSSAYLLRQVNPRQAIESCS